MYYVGQYCSALYFRGVTECRRGLLEYVFMLVEKRITTHNRWVVVHCIYCTEIVIRYREPTTLPVRLPGSIRSKMYGKYECVRHELQMCHDHNTSVCATWHQADRPCVEAYRRARRALPHRWQSVQNECNCTLIWCRIQSRRPGLMGIAVLRQCV